MDPRRKTTKDDNRAPLTPQQCAAVDLFAVGRNVSEVADAVGVTRQTASVWLNQSRTFRAALGKRRGELWETAVARLRALVLPSIDLIERELQGNSLSAALAVLRTVGLREVGPPPDPQSVEEVELRERERASDLRLRLMGLDIMP